ncbi:MAG TPA: Fur family transcriptional regulator [Ktedonobacterales bacterium]
MSDPFSHSTLYTLLSHSSAQQEELGRRLRHLGLRVTPQRLLVMQALASGSGHLTADEIMRWTAERYPAINLATIYRTLDLLTSVGLVTQTDLGSGVAHFELVGDSLHHHLICEHCGAMVEVDDALLAPVRERLLRDHGFRASARHIALFGTCKHCLEESRGKSTALQSASQADSTNNARMTLADSALDTDE